MNRTGAIAMAATLLACAGAGATAEPGAAFGDREYQTLTVHFDDLDLRKPAGIATLHARLRVAARNVCTGFDFGFRGAAEEDNCRTSALEEAVSKLPAAVQTHHARWVANGSKWLSGQEPLPTHQVVIRR